MKNIILIFPLLLFCACENKPLSVAQQNFAKNCLKDIEWFMRDDKEFNSDPHTYRIEYGKYCDCVARHLSDSIASAGTFKFGLENLVEELRKCGANIYIK